MQRLDLLALIMTVLFLVLGLTKSDLPANDSVGTVAVQTDSTQTITAGVPETKELD